MERIDELIANPFCGVSDTGQTWSTPSGRSAWRVFSGKLRPDADANSVAFLDLGTSSHITTFDLAHALGAYEFWCLFDVVSLDNMYRFGRLNATTLAFQKQDMTCQVLPDLALAERVTVFICSLTADEFIREPILVSHSLLLVSKHLPLSLH